MSKDRFYGFRATNYLGVDVFDMSLRGEAMMIPR